MGTSVAIDAVVRPVVRALPADLTPLRALAAVESSPHTVFLESGGSDGPDARWTILAFDPLWRLELRGGALWRTEGRTAASIPGPPLEALARVWPPRIVLDAEPLASDGPSVPFAGAAPGSGASGGAALPFVTGLAGYLSYDLKDQIERFPGRARRESSCADLSLGFYDIVWAWERASGRGWVIATGLPEMDPKKQVDRARARLDRQWERVVGAEGRTADAPAVPAARVSSNFTRDSYGRMVERALEHIAAGDIYQVNLAQRFRVEPAPAPEALYRWLRAESPAPFAAYLSFPGGGIASSSPERFFRVEDERIETWPIKGTRPRGATPAEDAALAAALRASEKDRAENVMIVDLERNDLGRICEVGSITVPALWDVASYANVHHLVSCVEGKLRENVVPVDVIRAVFPGGSITGAPKIRAVEIIDSLEPVRRGVYTGAIGFWDVRGGCDWNIAIRTIIVEGGCASFHVGGGIVADSTPYGEYEETLIKARGMLRALGARWEG